MMFALKGIIFYLFGWLMLFGSNDLGTLPSASYTPVDNISATDDHDHSPLFLDAVFEVNQSSTHETPPVKTFTQPSKPDSSPTPQSSYSLSYYTIGQQIVVNFTIKDIIFPFHCFT
ncbi:hypothetical protein [Gelidibacter sp.]|uniref:hypothetical protein n=1 Tax=Gelidibacter sp. TaxID=2018083 RepID=UPI002C466D78|nr:hypothetical protein [Gelidibacter sp.]HUH27211.1 hypothetical protein [Gelidibacter sp.]